MSTKNPSVAREDALEKVLANAAHSRREGKPLDPSVVALAMWIADPGSGRLDALISDSNGTEEDPPAPSWLGIVYVQLQEDLGQGTQWDLDGAHASPRIEKMKKDCWGRGLVMRRFSVAPQNLSGFRKEFQLPGLEINDLRAALGGLEPTETSADRFSMVMDAVGAGEDWGDLQAEPWSDENFLGMLVRHCTDDLHDRILRAPDALRIKFAQKAIAHENQDWLVSLLDAGVSPNSQATDVEWNLIHLAASGQLEMLQLLAQRGADLTARDGLGNTSLHYATEDARIAAYLLEQGLGMYDRNNAGNIALHEMLRKPWIQGDATENMIAVVDQMISLGADVSYVPSGADESYLTPFQMAVKLSSPSQVEALLKRCDLDLGQRTIGGRTLMQLANKSAPMKELLRSWKAILEIQGQLAKSGQLGEVASTRSLQSNGPL